MAEVGIRSLVECAVCTDTLTNHRALPCQHIFCLKCLEPLVRDLRITCPLCREECLLKPAGVSSLPRSPLLVGILDRFCVECMDRTNDIKCSHCNKHLCQECHRTCRLSLDGDLEKTKEETDILIAVLKGERVKIEDERERFQKETLAVSAQIDKRADEIVNAVRNQQKTLHAQLSEETLSGKMHLSECTVRSAEEVEKLQLNVDAVKKETENYVTDWRKYNDMYKLCSDLKATLSNRLESITYRTKIDFNDDDRVAIPLDFSIGQLRRSKCTLNVGNDSGSASGASLLQRIMSPDYPRTEYVYERYGLGRDGDISFAAGRGLGRGFHNEQNRNGRGRSTPGGFYR